jgi:hypothetical protein
MNYLKLLMLAAILGLSGYDEADASTINYTLNAAGGINDIGTPTAGQNGSITYTGTGYGFGVGAELLPDTSIVFSYTLPSTVNFSTYPLSALIFASISGPTQPAPDNPPPGATGYYSTQVGGTANPSGNNSTSYPQSNTASAFNNLAIVTANIPDPLHATVTFTNTSSIDQSAGATLFYYNAILGQFASGLAAPSITYQVSAVPLPASLIFFLTGLALLYLSKICMRKKVKSNSSITDAGSSASLSACYRCARS